MLHEHDLAAGYGRVYLPHALARNTPMPIGSGGGSMCFRQTGSRQTRAPRHPTPSHPREGGAAAVHMAVRHTRMVKRATPHTFRHSFARIC